MIILPCSFAVILYAFTPSYSTASTFIPLSAVKPLPIFNPSTSINFLSQSIFPPAFSQRKIYGVFSEPSVPSGITVPPISGTILLALTTVYGERFGVYAVKTIVSARFLPVLKPYSLIRNASAVVMFVSDEHTVHAERFH